MKFFLSGPVKGVRKSYALWVESGIRFQPLVYFQKPKWVKDDAAWEKFICGAFTMISAEGQAALNEMLESAVLDREVRND
jgi:hypothetical protein